MVAVVVVAAVVTAGGLFGATYQRRTDGRRLIGKSIIFSVVALVRRLERHRTRAAKANNEHGHTWPQVVWLLFEFESKFEQNRTDDANSLRVSVRCRRHTSRSLAQVYLA